MKGLVRMKELSLPRDNFDLGIALAESSRDSYEVFGRE